MLRVGVLGAGFMGVLHARAYRALPGATVAAISSLGSDRGRGLARELGARHVINSMDVVTDPEIDAIDICLPTPLHSRFTIAALQAGKHVFVEKPLSFSLEEADEVLQTWRKTDRVLMVAHVLRFWPEYVALRECLERGDIGNPLAAFAWRLSTAPTLTRLSRDPALAGGAVLDLHIHDLDLFNWLFGKPRRVSATGVQTSRGSWDHVHTTVTYADLSAIAEASSLLPSSWPFTMGLRIVGESGAIEYAFRAAGPSVEMGMQREPALTLYRDSGDPLPIPVQSRSAYESEVEYFVDHASRGQPVQLGSPNDAYRALALSLGARQSLVEGRPIDLNLL